MSFIKSLSRKNALALALTFLITIFVLFLPSWSAHAQVGFWSKIQDFFGFPVEEAPAYGRSKGGAGRGPICTIATDFESQSTQSISVLMPVIEGTFQGNNSLQQGVTASDSELGGEYVGGYTVGESPTLWFYVPYISKPSDSVQIAQFTLLNTVKQPIWNELVAFKLSPTSQLFEYTLPYSLEVNRLYDWYFTVICDSDKYSRNPAVRGWIQRTEPSAELQTALRNANLLQRQEYEAYANNGIWFETVNSLVESLRQSPGNGQLRELWIGLLEYFNIPNPEQLDVFNPAEIVERKVID